MSEYTEKVQRSARPAELIHLATYADKIARLGEVHSASIVFTSLDSAQAVLGEVWFDKEGEEWRVDFANAGTVPA